MVSTNNEQDAVNEETETDRLRAENDHLKEQLFLANEIQLEVRQFLANVQFELYLTKAKLKYATQPTA